MSTKNTQVSKLKKKCICTIKKQKQKTNKQTKKKQRQGVLNKPDIR